MPASARRGASTHLERDQRALCQATDAVALVPLVLLGQVLVRNAARRLADRDELLGSLERRAEPVLCEVEVLDLGLKVADRVAQDVQDEAAREDKGLLAG